VKDRCEDEGVKFYVRGEWWEGDVSGSSKKRSVREIQVSPFVSEH
jgi:hypothetical protein